MLYAAFFRGWLAPYENFSVLYFNLIDPCVLFFTLVAFSCFEIEPVTVIVTFYTYAIQYSPYQGGFFFVGTVVINGKQLSIEIEKGDEFAKNFDAFSFPRGYLPKTSHFINSIIRNDINYD